MRKKIYFIVIFILLLIGGTYAYFTFTYVNEDVYQLIDDVYINFESGSTFNVTDAFPESDASARSKETSPVTVNSHSIPVASNEMLFYIEGSNDSNDTLRFTLLLNEGSPISNKSRIKSKFLKFDLVEYNISNNTETMLIEGLKFPNINDTTLYYGDIDTNSTHYYKLRMWIDENLIISDTDPDADYGAYSSTTKTLFKNTYASIKVTCIGELV